MVLHSSLKLGKKVSFPIKAYILKIEYRIFDQGINGLPEAGRNDPSQFFWV